MPKTVLVKLVVVLAVVFGGAVSAAAGSNTCHVFPRDADRLKCYDQKSGYKSSQTKADSSSTVGNQWRLETQTSSLDGRTDVWLSVQSNGTQPNQIGQPERATLYVRCMNNSTNFFVSFNDYTPDNQTVRYRTDDSSVKKIWMVHMQGGEGIGLWSGGKAIPFVKALYEVETLVLAYESYNNLNLEFTFDISGLRAKIGELARSCNWKP